MNNMRKTKLVADSGATKTDWRIIKGDGEIEQARTAGFSPYYQTTEEILTELRTHLLPNVQHHIDEVHFYGTGCSSADKVKIVEDALRPVFPEASIFVDHDLLAAARALCGHEPGIACILGTGSNSCLYDGEKIVDQLPNLGFWLGDEGSGGYLGKKLIQDFIHKEMPQDLWLKFEKRYKVDRDILLDHLYKKPFPSRYAASFAKFLFDHRSTPYAYQLVYNAFDEFFKKSVNKYENYQSYRIHFTGSVAFYYNDILRQLASDRGVVVKNILESPIAGLTLYHTEEGKLR
jgi:glucosamine kinase